MNRIALVPSAIVALALLAAPVSEAQMDVAKILAGKWEGEVEFMGTRGNLDPNRTLVINSVTEKDGKWVAEGRFGVTGKGLGRVQVEVDTSGPNPRIRFVTAANQTVRLDVVDDRHMTGTLAAMGAGARGSDHRPLRLEKTQ